MEQLIGRLFSGDMREWIPIPRCRAGERLYHYTDLKALKGIVMDHVFWVTKSDFLNDKFEFRYASKVVKRVCEKLIPNSENRKLVSRRLKIEMNSLNQMGEERLLAGWYVLSFSREQDSLLLWTEYAKSQGYSMEFDYGQLADGFREGIRLDGYVIYNKEQQYELVEHTFHRVLNYGEEERKGLKKKLLSRDQLVTEEELCHFIREFAACCFVYSMFFKKECFQEEREYRFVFWAVHEELPGERETGVVPMEFREKDQTLIPYIQLPYQQAGVENPIRSITVGPKNNSDLAVKGIQYFLRNEKISIPVYDSKIPLRY